MIAAVGAGPEPRAGEVAQVPPARPGDVAIYEELVAARATRRPAAYELFIARHPSHPLARIARAELNVLRGERK